MSKINHYVNGTNDTQLHAWDSAVKRQLWSNRFLFPCFLFFLSINTRKPYIRTKKKSWLSLIPFQISFSSSRLSSLLYPFHIAPFSSLQWFHDLYLHISFTPFLLPFFHIWTSLWFWITWFLLSFAFALASNFRCYIPVELVVMVRFA